MHLHFLSSGKNRGSKRDQPSSFSSFIVGKVFRSFYNRVCLLFELYKKVSLAALYPQSKKMRNCLYYIYLSVFSSVYDSFDV